MKSKEEISAYRKEYHKNNKERAAATSKKYYEKNKELIASKRAKRTAEGYDKIWRDKNIDKALESCRKHYYKNKDVLLTNNKEKYSKRRKAIDEIKVDAGCQNPNCQWVGKFIACDLDFHHIDSSKKEQSVTAMINGSLTKLTAEINQCTILCAICHRRATYNKENITCKACSLTTEELEKRLK